jgi:hypothetical protein
MKSFIDKENNSCHYVILRNSRLRNYATITIIRGGGVIDPPYYDHANDIQKNVFEMGCVLNFTMTHPTNVANLLILSFSATIIYRRKRYGQL